MIVLTGARRPGKTFLIKEVIKNLTEPYLYLNGEGYSRNLRKEISKSSRYYFWDNGIRNMLIANFNDLLLRNDVGQLWENYIISERIKLQNCQGWASNYYFWRTYDQQEIDWIEEREGGLFAFEMKYKNHPVKVPGGWAKNYPHATFKVVHKENYLKFITQKDFS